MDSRLPVFALLGGKVGICGGRSGKGGGAYGGKVPVIGDITKGSTP